MEIDSPKKSLLLPDYSMSPGKHNSQCVLRHIKAICSLKNDKLYYDFFYLLIR